MTCKGTPSFQSELFYAYTEYRGGRYCNKMEFIAFLRANYERVMLFSSLKCAMLPAYRGLALQNQQEYLVPSSSYLPHHIMSKKAVAPTFRRRVAKIDACTGAIIDVYPYADYLKQHEMNAGDVYYRHIFAKESPCL